MLKLSTYIFKGLAILLFLFQSSASSMEHHHNTQHSTGHSKPQTRQLNNYLEVKQNEIILTSIHYPVQYLFTLGLEPCIGLRLKAGDWVAVAHLDGSPMKYVLNKVIKQMEQHSGRVPEATIFYSSSFQESTFDRLTAILDENGISYLSKNEQTETLNVSIDVQTNESMYDFDRRQDNRPVHNPDWNLGEDWVRGTGQYPLLKFMTVDNAGELHFNPDNTEKYLAHRYFTRQQQPVEENHAMHEAEEDYLEEQESIKHNQ